MLNRDGRAYVFSAQAGRAHRIEVTVGATGPRWVEIRSGAEPGDAVITGPLIERLADGAPIFAAESPPGGEGENSPLASLPNVP